MNCWQRIEQLIGFNIFKAEKHDLALIFYEIKDIESKMYSDAITAWTRPYHQLVAYKKAVCHLLYPNYDEQDDKLTYEYAPEHYDSVNKMFKREIT